MPNHLAHENSPYLLQHANNPVEWYPWGEEALARARAEDKPIFLSIGYAACHWCHVMAHESFEDPSIAELMNANFINIKVDREERPDLDSIYMSATVSMTGSGGWPMSVFLTPGLQPFYAGTYFPPAPRFNMPSFRDLLTGISNAWREDREELLRVSAQVVDHMLRSNDLAGGKSFPLTQSLLANAADHLVQSYDWGFGGWGEAPKFPQPMTIEFLLSQATRDGSAMSTEAREKYLQTVVHVLKAMARGGMYDVVGGGFARYSTDNLWKVPHFEKMLYDNAQLARVYLHAWLVSGEPAFRRVCQETLDFILRELTQADGGFFSSLDADSEGQEGRFYTWEYAELEQALGADFEFFKAAYGLSKQTLSGSLEGRLVLQRALDDGTLAARFKIDPDLAASRLEACHARLLDVRAHRVRPATDDKVLTAWNALALTAFAEAGRFLDRPDYLEAAERNARFLLANLRISGQLFRSWRAGSPKQSAYLEDYASLSSALLALYQSQPEIKWYSEALDLAGEIVAHFTDPRGGFYDTRDDAEMLLLRPKDLQDNATPSGNALAVSAFLQLAEYGDHPEWRKLAEDSLADVLEAAVRYPTALAQWLCAADFALGPVLQVAVVGELTSQAVRNMSVTLWKDYRPRLVSAFSDTPPAPGGPLLLQDRLPINGQPAAYVCQGFVCHLPVTTPEALAVQLNSTNG